jgi:cytochrome c1
MFDEWWKIDKRMGESRFAQVLGIVIIISLLVFSVLWSYIKF